ncbi:hypothetical protein ONS95_010923 [Cadophora gregata]|uniref:uncharacterized protein n=1 Tax=Cadophora gregata TaxID=51156 RepID=UPI0026DC892F|nr:uncharacterized protein ONS95_010923 [Cadophora gregata]KAK0119476.1 hypothetical protein ONS95_010923 [Cadophora gregata]KAK0120517.1 hypothetical protein ONS96_010724 [Cadophora gregata f. sp. sojae]
MSSQPNSFQRRIQRVNEALFNTGSENNQSLAADSLSADDVTKTYLLLLSNAASLEFLRSSAFAKALDKPARSVGTCLGYSMNECIEELRRFLAIKVYTSDEGATKISPTPLMDEGWHAAILNTQFYVKLQEALGITLHHRPEGAVELDQKPTRLAAMKALYKTFFQTEPLTDRFANQLSHLPH